MAAWKQSEWDRLDLAGVLGADRRERPAPAPGPRLEDEDPRAALAGVEVYEDDGHPD